MRNALAIGLIVAALFGHDQAFGQKITPQGFNATIVKVHAKSVELSILKPNEDEPRGVPVAFEVTKDTKFEEVDYKFVDGKLQVTRKTISLGDLAPTQEISGIAIVAGERPILLVGIVAGGATSSAEALKAITKLGGKIRNIAWKKGEIRYAVDLSDSKVTDETLLLVASIKQLDTLDLSNTKISDKGIAYFVDHPNLYDITLSGTQVTNGVLAHLAKIRKLNRVSVDQTAVTRDAIQSFATKKNLYSFCHFSAGEKCEYRVHEIVRPDPGERHYLYLMKRNVYYARFYTEGAARRTATTYYHRDGPVGAVLRRYEWFPRDAGNDDPSDARLPASVVGLSAMSACGFPMDALACLWSEPAIGVVELNGGTIAAYGRPFQNIDFYNDIPELTRFNVEINGKDPPFGFIEDAKARGSHVRVIEGPFKKTVRKESPRGYYSAVFIDITVQQREDAETTSKKDVHFDLMTQEALRDLMDKTTPDGVVCFHTSHRTHEFHKPLSAAAATLGFAVKKVNAGVNRYLDEKTTFAERSQFNSEWLVIARKPAVLERFRSELTKTRELLWVVPRADEAPAWRDGVEPAMPIRMKP